MIPVLIYALISLSVAMTDLDKLYPELEHSRTIYVTGECVCSVQFFCNLTMSHRLAESKALFPMSFLCVAFTTLTLQCH